jgi:hypothetical protein
MALKVFALGSPDAPYAASIIRAIGTAPAKMAAAVPDDHG